MSSIGKIISENRKNKGLSQERLAELSKVNLRTIQRIEAEENSPRGETLNLICEVLALNIEDVKRSVSPRKPIIEIVINWVFLFGFNLFLMTIFGFLLIDSNANWNSRLGGLLLSFLLPLSIVYFSKEMSGVERTFKFGFGFIIYIFLSIIMMGFQNAIVLLIPVLLIALAVLYFGSKLFEITE